VRVPQGMKDMFAKAEETMGKVFEDFKWDPERGQIKIGGLRYMLVRTESMSLELNDQLSKRFGDIQAAQIAFRFGRACGMRDARRFHSMFKAEDPIDRLALGPIHFAYTGWAFVDIFEQSNPTMDEDYYLVYDHPFSFEAEAYIEAGIKAERPVCHMNSGYSSGWCQESFGVELKAEELTCRAMGHPKCVFVMAHPKRFDEMAARARKELGL
jgi:predicted hydrocarbon binding protein